VEQKKIKERAMILSGHHMLGEVAEMVKALFPDGCEVTMENLRALRRNHICVERDVGLANFRGRSLVRFATALAEAGRMRNNEYVQVNQIEELIMWSFCNEGKVYDRAMDAYNGAVAKRILPPPSQKEDLRILNDAAAAAEAVWDEDLEMGKPPWRSE
jgi:hypothetical protein